jgi:adenylate kinase family enzyme
MNRIAIIGNGAGGKTTLARALSTATGIPVCHVDTLQFTAGGRRTPRAELDAQLQEIEANPQ